MDVFVFGKVVEKFGELFHRFIFSLKLLKPVKDAGLAESGLGSGLQRNFSRKKVSSKPENVDIRVRRFESGARLYSW